MRTCIILLALTCALEAAVGGGGGGIGGSGGMGGGRPAEAPVVPAWTRDTAAANRPRVLCLETDIAAFRTWSASLIDLADRVPFVHVQGAQARAQAKQLGIDLPAVILVDAYGNPLRTISKPRMADLEPLIRNLPQAAQQAGQDVRTRLARIKAALAAHPDKVPDGLARLATLAGYPEAAEAKRLLDGLVTKP